jgi:[acyl-carrier-protein] S-malonyltransferase
MKKLVFMFPGQGSQFIGMGKDFYDKYTAAKNIIDYCDEELKNVIFSGPEESLKDTKYAQPAIFAVSCAMFEVLKNSINLDNFEIVTAGHSLGEYSALYAAGFFNFENGLKIVKARGGFIAQASSQNPGGMAAIIGMAKQDVIDVCKQASSEGVCEPVNFNSPGQIVISGTKTALAKAVELAQAKGAKRAIMLNVSGPFHSSLMKPAAEQMKAELEKFNFLQPKYSVITNCDAQQTKDNSLIKDKLVKQVASPVLWDSSITNSINDGFDTFVEIGPGKVLSGLVKRIDRTKNILNIEKVEDLEKVTEELKK